MAPRTCCSASGSFFRLKAPQAFSYSLLAFEGTPNLIALTVAPRTSLRSHGRHATSSTTVGWGIGSTVGRNTPGCELSIPGIVSRVGQPPGPGDVPVPPDPRVPPVPVPPVPPVPRVPPVPVPPEGAPFCARTGMAHNMIVTAHNITGFSLGIVRCLVIQTITLIVALFYAVSS